MPAKSKLSKKSQINLIPQEGFASTTSGRVLSWVLSTFRVIVILTEILVIIAFISRFWLDAKNSDVSESIDHAKQVLSSQQEFEKEFRDVQERLDTYKNYTSQRGKFPEVLNTITSQKPPNIIFNSVNIGGDGVTIEAIAPNEISFQQFIVNLKSSAKFQDVALVSASEEKGKSYYTFTLSLTYEDATSNNPKDSNNIPKDNTIPAQ